jgi:hypothetical protein
MEGIDYAWSKPSPAALVRAGKEFVCRYLAYLPNGKALSPSEREALHAAGLSIVLNWEQASGDMLKGYAKGLEHAREAVRQADALGAPHDVPIYFSCDVDVTTSSEMDAVTTYLQGAIAVLGRHRVGVYGEYSVIEALVPNVCDWGWQTYAWSGGRVSSKAHIYQYKNGVQVGGADCDLNRSLKNEIGAWSPMELSGRSLELLNNVDRYLNAITQMSPEIPLLNNGKESKWQNMLATAVVAAAAPLSDEQITALSQQFAQETSTEAIETALRNVLRKGVDNAG